MQYPVTVRETILLLIAVDSVPRFDQDLQETETLKELSSYITQAHAHGKSAKEGREREECTGKKEAWNEHRKKNKVKKKSELKQTTRLSETRSLSCRLAAVVVSGVGSFTEAAGCRLLTPRLPRAFPGCLPSR